VVFNAVGVIVLLLGREVPHAIAIRKGVPLGSRLRGLVLLLGPVLGLRDFAGLALNLVAVLVREVRLAAELERGYFSSLSAVLCSSSHLQWGAVPMGPMS